MKTIQYFLLLFFVLFSIQCSDDIDDVVESPAHDFVWKGLNLYYLWQTDSPDLSDDKFENQQLLNSYYKSFNSPDDLFYHLL